MDRTRFLEAFPAFRAAPGTVWSALLEGAREVSLSAGQIVYRPGDECAGIGLLASGGIRVYKTGPSGREITLYEIAPGETCVLNVSCILAHRSYPVFAEAIEASRLLLLDRDTFVRLLDESPAVRAYVHGLYIARLEAVLELVDEVVFGRLEDRLSEYLLARSENGVLTATHQHIANDLGTSREVISRLLKDLERRGRVHLARGMVRIVDL